MKNCSITFILIYIVNIIKMFLMKISGDLDDISISEGGTHPKMVQNTNRLTVDKRALILLLFCYYYFSLWILKL